MTRGALVAAALALLLGSSADDLRVSLRAAAAAYLGHIAAIAPVTGRDTTYDYYSARAPTPTHCAMRPCRA